MSDTTPLYQAFYVSRLAPGSAYDVVNDIVSAARRANPERGITGALLFDGEYFGQLLEGREADVLALLKRIEADPRHTDVAIIFSGVTGAPRHTPAWRSGYCDAHQLDLFFSDASLRGTVALAFFMSILVNADVD
jgi:hypothetical protein